ncbi:hypothetical protein Agabi119p4_3763 [Agaricus bisporus var. burnettii]|uniref:Uncharacterized protein n=1 Tax=Agaricus bisporus var. burnettii TaxID=192524 RepID=A0A8H7F5M9_AGABI|nr:hypothetical protein Agabi119p4_3763 [Agaricus bisporus var. burnettii]
MVNPVAISNPQDLPGAGFDFRDVRQLFEDAAADMHEQQMLFMDGFSLQDAMAAFEIGEPRLDSGYIAPGDTKVEFNPLALLLPEELCWIIDTALFYEMEWHNGNFMSHSVHTFLYFHHLDYIDPDIVPSYFLNSNDPLRPPELITVVLRAAVAGLLKCCDLTWRELSKGAVQDTEDWQSDKCEVYLLEGTPVRVVISMLEEASVWVSDSPKIPYYWKNHLVWRLQLRKAFLQLLDSNVHRPLQFQVYLRICQESIENIRSQPLHQPSEGSPARLAFDPYVSRSLNTAVPIRVLHVGSFSETLDALDAFFEGLKEISQMAGVHSVSTWKAVGLLHVWNAKLPIAKPYIRSFTQSAFYNGVLVFDQHSPSWLVDRFFHETIGITWAQFQGYIHHRWVGTSPPPLNTLERDIHKLAISDVKGNWSNQPRRRRQLMKSLIGWHRIYDVLTEMLFDVNVSDLPNNHILLFIPKTVLLWRLSSIREIVLSGFQLEFYSPEEKTFAYWYLTRVFEMELECFENLLAAMPPDTLAYREMIYNQQLTTALQALCASLFIMTIPLLSFNWRRTKPNFFRRYKWAFKPEYEQFVTEPVGQPDLAEFMRVCLGILKNGVTSSPREGIEFAVGLLRDMLTGSNEPVLGAWAQCWIGERREFIEKLISVAEGLFAVVPAERNRSSLNGALTILSSSPSHPTTSSSPSITVTETVASSSTIVRAANAPNNEENDDEYDVCDGEGKGKLLRNVRAEKVNLRWDVNVHPWFPIPVVDRHLPGTEVQ